MAALVLAAVVVGLDLLTKWLVSTRLTEFVETPVIPGFFSLQFVHNPGAAFGMLAGQQWLFIVVALGAVGGMLYFLRHPEGRVGLIPYALGLLMGGAIGNLVDRIRFNGEVVDFLLFYWRDYHFPNFNVADIGITLGVGLFLLQTLRTGERNSE